jgi:1-deoxy-D-xylulose-5-phosphate reductoisomerase
MTKKIVILGSTGSIGKSALRVIESLGDDYQVYALTAKDSIDLLAEQARQFKPKYIGIANKAKYPELKAKIGDINTQILAGAESLEQIAVMDEVNLVLAGVVGAAGLGAILAAAKVGKTLAIANKEPLVMAGKLLINAAKSNNAKILPVDSEHCALFQCLNGEDKNSVAKLILTASGGPFRTATKQEMDNATVDDALAHPTWNMGPKITIDSATMMNKALEIIEAHWLFDVPVDKIEVLVHPESIVHSLVEFIDGSVIAQLGTPDMCHPIQFALTYPQRQAGITKHLKLYELGKLTFERPNTENFRALKVVIDVAKARGSAPIVFNAANEAAVGLFLERKIKFGQILELIELALSKHNIRHNLNLDEILEVDDWARKFVISAVKH